MLVAMPISIFCLYKGKTSEHYCTALLFVYNSVCNRNIIIIMLPKYCAVCCKIRRRKKTETPTAVAMSAIDTDGNTTINDCSQYLPKGVSDFAEIDPQSQYEYMSDNKTSGDVDPHYMEAPWNPPRVIFADGNGEPCPEYETMDEVYAGYLQSKGECSARRFQ